MRRSKVASSFCRSGYIEWCSGKLRPADFRGVQRAIRLPGRLEPPGVIAQLYCLEVELQSKLHQTRIARLQHLPEGRSC